MTELGKASGCRGASERGSLSFQGKERKAYEMTAEQCRNMQVKLKNKETQNELSPEYALWEIAAQLAEFNERDNSWVSQGKPSS